MPIYDWIFDSVQRMIATWLLCILLGFLSFRVYSLLVRGKAEVKQIFALFFKFLGYIFIAASLIYGTAIFKNLFRI
jgi:hypothetical protein